MARWTGRCGRGGLAGALVALCVVGAPAHADSAQPLWKLSSDAVYPFLVLGELSLYSGGQRGHHEAWQGFQALTVTAVEVEALKRLTREQRPNRTGRDSFPSMHAAEAFTMATVISQYKPKCTWLAYGSATLISYSRIPLKQHHWYDVVAGAGLGYLNGRLFAHHVALTPRGLAYNTTF